MRWITINTMAIYSLVFEQVLKTIKLKSRLAYSLKRILYVRAKCSASL